MSRDPRFMLDRLRRYRVRPEYDRSIADTVANAQRQAQNAHRRLGHLMDLWLELVPAELAEATTLAHLRHGVLYVDVEHAAARFELDRLLRDGLEQRLRERYRGTLRRVRLRQGGR